MIHGGPFGVEFLAQGRWHAKWRSCRSNYQLSSSLHAICYYSCNSVQAHHVHFLWGYTDTRCGSLGCWTYWAAAALRATSMSELHTGTHKHPLSPAAPVDPLKNYETLGSITLEPSLPLWLTNPAKSPCGAPAPDEPGQTSLHFCVLVFKRMGNFCRTTNTPSSVRVRCELLSSWRLNWGHWGSAATRSRCSLEICNTRFVFEEAESCHADYRR